MWMHNCIFFFFNVQSKQISFMMQGRGILDWTKASITVKSPLKNTVCAQMRGWRHCELGVQSTQTGTNHRVLKRVLLT